MEKNPPGAALDCGCGTGWLTYELSKLNFKAVGCDISERLILEAKQAYPALSFEVADMETSLPYNELSFDVIVLNMVFHNLARQDLALANLRKILKPGGRLLVISVNPYYAFPVGSWKRGLWNFITRKKPALRLAEYFELARDKRGFFWTDKKIPSRFSTLPEQLNALLNGGFRLMSLRDLCAETDGKDFDFNYRLSRFPLLLLMAFEKN